MTTLIKNLIDKLDNDTLIIIGLIVLALVYSVSATGEQIVGNIVAGFVGYLGGQYAINKN